MRDKKLKTLKMVEIQEDITDILIFDNIGSAIAKNINMGFHGTTYAICCGDKIVCSCGSDIMDAENILSELKGRFPHKKFYRTSEFPSFE